MSDFWTYEPRIVRRQRQRQQFEAQAKQHAAQTVITQQVSDAGYDPSVVPTRTTMYSQPVIRGSDVDSVIGPHASEKASGGTSLLGKVGGIIDDAASTVFGGEVRQPWDLLRPVKRVMDAENRYISEPLARGVYEGVTGGDYADAPGVLKLGLETLTSPSTYLLGGIPGLGATNVGKLGAMKLSKFALETGSETLGKAARVASAVTGAPHPIGGGSSGAAITGPADTALRDLLGGQLPTEGLSVADTLTNHLKSIVGIGPAKDDALASPIMRARSDLKQTADALSVRLSAVAGKQVREAFQPNALGRIESLPGAPTIQDVAARLPEFAPHLSPEQTKVLQGLREEMDYYGNALKEQGVEFGSRTDVMDGIDGVQDGGFYLPRGTATPPGAEATAARGAGGRGKSGYRKTATFNSMTEGLDAGYTYQPFEDALRTHAKSAANDAIDAYTAKTFQGLSDEAGNPIAQTMHDRLEEYAPGLQDRVQKLRDKVTGRLDTLVRQQTRGMAQGVAETRLNRLLSGVEERVQQAMGKADAAMIGSDGMVRAEAELNALDREANRIAGATQSASERTAGTSKAMDATQQEIDTLRGELDGIKGDYTRALERARGTPRDAGQIQLNGLQGTSFPTEIADAANKYLMAENRNPNSVGGIVKALNGLLRGVSATGDASFAGIQGILGAAHTPGAYGKAMSVVAHGFNDPVALGKYIEQFDQRAAQVGLANSREWIKAGLHLGGIETEYQAGQTIAGATGLLKQSARLGNAPVLKQSNQAFGLFGDALRLEGAQVMQAANQGASMSELAQAANLMTGWTKGKFLGDVGDFVQFAPRFFQSQLELMARAVNPADSSATAQMARQMLTKMIGIGTMTTVLANEALGGVTDFNPTSSNFMRIRAAGQDVSLFGPWDSLVKAIVHTGKGLTTGSMNDVLYLPRSKASPLISKAWDVIKGTNAVGQPVTPESFLSGFLPFSAQNVVSGDALPKDANGVAALGLNLAGVKAAPLSKADLLDEAAREAYGKGWDDLSAKEVSRLAMKAPDSIDEKTVRAAEGVRKVLAPYKDIETQVWDKVNDRPELAGYATLDEYVAAKTQELVKMGVPPGQVHKRLQQVPVIQQFQDAVDTLHKRYRLAHPEADVVLQDWYGMSPIKRAA